MAQSVKGKTAILGVAVGIVIAVGHEEHPLVFCPHGTHCIRSASAYDGCHIGIAEFSNQGFAITVYKVHGCRMHLPGTGTQVLQFRAGFVGGLDLNKDVLPLVLTVFQKRLDTVAAEIHRHHNTVTGPVFSAEHCFSHHGSSGRGADIQTIQQNIVSQFPRLVQNF